MEINEIRDNFLLSIGCSIKESYDFIYKMEYDFSEKTEDRILEIGRHKVPLTKLMLNCRKLNRINYFSKENFKNKTVIEEIENAYEILFNNCIAYYGEYLKFVTNNFNIDEKTLNSLIICITSYINTTDTTIRETLNKYNAKLEQVSRKVQNQRDELNSEIYAKAITSAAHGRSYTYKTFTGDVVTSHSSSVGNISKDVSYNNASARADETVGHIEAKIEYIKKFDETKISLLKEFEKKILEIMAIKFPDMLNYDVIIKCGNGIDDNPTYFKNWENVINELEETDLDNVREALDYYGINIDLTNQVVNNITQYYAKTFKCDYNGTDLKFMGKEINKNHQLAMNIIKIIRDDIDEKYQKNNNYKFEKEKENIKECIYLSDEIKNTLIKRCDDYILDEKKARRKTKLKIVVIIILAIAIGLFITFFDEIDQKLEDIFFPETEQVALPTQK